MAGKYQTYDPAPLPEAPAAGSKYKIYDPEVPPSISSGYAEFAKRLGAGSLTTTQPNSFYDHVKKSAKEVSNSLVVENAQLDDALKGKGVFDDTSTFEDINGKTSLFDVGRSNENTEKYRKFKASWPKGDIMFVPTDNGTVPVARTSPDQPFRRLGNWGPTLAGIVSPQTVASVAAAAATGGASLPVSIGLQALAGAAGSVIDNQIEAARGYQDSSGWSQAGDAAIEGTIGGAMEWPSRWVTGAIGKGKESVLNSFSDLAAAGKEVPILKGQVGNPIKKTVFRLVSLVSPTAQYVLRQQRAAIKGMVEGDAAFTPEMIASFSDKELNNYIQLYTADVILGKFGSVNAAAKNATGKLAIKGMTRLKEMKGAVKDSLYADAFAKGENEMWNANPAKKFVEEHNVPVEGRADAQGAMGAGVYGDVPVSAPLDKELASIYKVITDLDPVIAMHKGNSGIKQLQTLRTRVGDLLQQDLPSTQEADAKGLYKVLTNIIENPATGNEAFVKAWSSANAANREYENFLRFAEVKSSLLAGAKPEKVVNKIFKPDNLDFVTYLRDNLVADPDSAPAWDALKTRFREQYLTNTKKMAGAAEALAKYEPEELNVLMSKTDQDNVLLASTQAKQILNGPLSTMINTFNTQGARILDFAGKVGNEAEIKRLVDTAGGVNSDTASALRAGVFQNLLEKSVYLDENTGQSVINPKRLSNAISELRKSKRLNYLFSPKDWQRFSNWEKVGAVVGTGYDNGTSIQMGEIASELTQAPFHAVANPAKLGGLILRLGFMDKIGYVLSRPETFEKVLAAGDNMQGKRRDRMLLNISGQALANIRRGWENSSNIDPMSANEVKAQELQQDGGLWNYLKEKFSNTFDPGQTPANAPIPQQPEPYPAVPPTGQQGSLQPAQRSGIMSTTNMAQAMPPRPAAPMAQPSPAQGSKYAALFPRDNLGAMAASGGIASLRG